jgi:hypothetical protein
MSDFSREQSQLEALAKKRRYFKSAADFLASNVTKEFAEGLIARITATRDAQIVTYDSVNPEDSLTIARCQAKREVCNEILADFNPDLCRNAIESLDNEIKKIHNTIEAKKEKAEQQVGGFNSL